MTRAVYFVACDPEGCYVFRADRGGTRAVSVAGPFDAVDAAWSEAGRCAEAEGDAHYATWPADTDADAVAAAIGIERLPRACWRVALPAPTPLAFRDHVGRGEGNP